MGKPKFKIITVKHYIGQRPEGMAADWMTGKDWDDFNAYMERCKADGTYGKEITSTLKLKSHPLFEGQQGLILDMESIETHTYKPLNELLK